MLTYQQLNYEQIDMPTSPEIELVVSTLRLSNAMWRASRRLFRPFGLTEAQFNILHVLEEADGKLSQRELSDILVVDRSNVTGLIDRMEAAGWVQRQSVPGDRRAYHIGLTTSGRKLWRKVYPAYREAASQVAGALSPAQIKSATDMLRSLESSAVEFEASLPAK